MFKKIGERIVQKKANAFIASLKGKSDEEVLALYNNSEFHDNEIVLSYIFFNHNSLIKSLPNDFQFSRINSNLDMFNFASDEVKVSLVSDWIHNNKLINNALVIRLSDEQFNEYCKLYFDQHEDLVLLHMEDLNRVLNILNNIDNIETEKIIEELKDKFTDRQWEFVIKVNPKFIKYASQTIQSKYCNDEKYVGFLTGEAKNNFINSQVDKVRDDFTLFDKMDTDVKAEFIKNCPYMINTLEQDTIVEILKKDINLIKYVNLSSYKNGKDTTQEFICNLLGDIDKKSNKDILDILINKNLLNAKGKLYRYDSKSDNISYQYTKKIIKLFQELKVEQILILVLADVNYVLPYIAPLYTNRAGLETRKNTVEEANSRALILFQKYYDQKICSDYIETINKIFDEYESHISESDYETDYRCELDLFKVLFNKNIINHNEPSKVIEFVNDSLKYRNVEDKNIRFKIIKKLNELLSNAYDTKINNNRELYNLNSLEIFDKKLDFIDEKLLYEFSKYNFVNISNLLLISKSPLALDLFKDYYKILSYIHKENTITLYKAIENFNYYKDILDDIKDKELDDKQINGLVLLLSEYNNKYNITKASELDSYDITLYKNLVNEISSVKDKNLYKNIICNYLFSRCYNTDGDSGWLEIDNIKTICDVYEADALEDIKISNRNLFTKDEANLFRMIKLLFSSDEFDLLLSFVESIINNNTKKNPISMLEFFNKLGQYKLELINNEIVSLREIEELYKDRPDIVLKNKREGVTIYTIIGQDFKVLVSENDDGIHYMCKNVVELDRNYYAYDRLNTDNNVRFSNENNETIIKLSKDSINKNETKVSYIIVVGKLSDELFKVAKENNLTIVEVKNE